MLNNIKESLDYRIAFLKIQAPCVQPYSDRGWEWGATASAEKH